MPTDPNAVDNWPNFGAAVGSEPAGGISRPGSRLGPTPKQPPPPLPVGGGGGHSIVLCRKGELGKTARKASKMLLCSASAKNAKRMGKNKRKLWLSKGLIEHVRVTIYPAFGAVHSLHILNSPSSFPSTEMADRSGTLDAFRVPPLVKQTAA